MPPLRIAVTGATGLLGRPLVASLRASGHHLIPLVRGTPRTGEVRWDPAGGWDPSGLDGADAIVHLAGENISAGRWTAAQKRRIEESRVNGTRSLVTGLGALRTPPRVLVSASAMGYYGDRGSVPIDENAPAGPDWLAGVVVGWEREAREAERYGCRVVLSRTGLILTPEGGVLGKMLPPFRAGVGGRLGTGMQWMSWIAIDDAVSAVTAAITDDRYQGPINLSTPAPVINREFTTTLGKVLGRPTIFPVPAAALRLIFGELADGALLASQRMDPAALRTLDFKWRFPELEGALRHLLGG
jgi:uncharacterized protein (TIGR01777 family)